MNCICFRLFPFVFIGFPAYAVNRNGNNEPIAFRRHTGSRRATPASRSHAFQRVLCVQSAGCHLKQERSEYSEHFSNAALWSDAIQCYHAKLAMQSCHCSKMASARFRRTAPSKRMQRIVTHGNRLFSTDSICPVAMLSIGRLDGKQSPLYGGAFASQSESSIERAPLKELH